MIKENDKKLNQSKVDAQTAEFWDTHDSVNYLSQTKPAKMTFPKPKHKVIVDLKEKEWRTLLKLAARRRIPYTSLLKKIVAKQLAAGH